MENDYCRGNGGPDQFVVAFSRCTSQLRQEDDYLIWRWTADGVYTTKLAYEVQLRGTYCTFNCFAVWKSKVEGKHWFFAWLQLQSNLLTADKLLLRNWPCNPLCSLCDQVPETAEYLCLHCVFSQEVWLQVSAWTGGLVHVPLPISSFESWWNSAIRTASKENKWRLASLMICSVWNIWKERNRRIFEHSLASPTRVFTLIKEDFELPSSPCGEDVLPLGGF